METLEFSVSERKLYDSIYLDVRKKFERLNERGLVNKNYTSILAMLMRYDLSLPYPVIQVLILEIQTPSGSSSPSSCHDPRGTRRA